LDSRQSWGDPTSCGCALAADQRGDSARSDYFGVAKMPMPVVPFLAYAAHGDCAGGIFSAFVHRVAAAADAVHPVVVVSR
jgi:hypothetical protein